MTLWEQALKTSYHPTSRADSRQEGLQVRWPKEAWSLLVCSDDRIEEKSRSRVQRNSEFLELWLRARKVNRGHSLLGRWQPCWFPRGGVGVKLYEGSQSCAAIIRSQGHPQTTSLNLALPSESPCNCFLLPTCPHGISD